TDYANVYNKDLERLTEVARQALARHITKQWQAEDGSLYVITVDPALEDEISNGVVVTEEGRQINLDPSRIQNILETLGREMQKAVQKGLNPVVLTSPRGRVPFKLITQRAAPNLVVLSFNEVVPDADIKPLGNVA
ncbi:MAG: FHIPEP family type III secretion protein, partial [Candidatus Lindowbacteria bacterium]|nr:FHIPEP family type III secretion protein [Candidatus Lindowbacteria bacterium]